MQASLPNAGQGQQASAEQQHSLELVQKELQLQQAQAALQQQQSQLTHQQQQLQQQQLQYQERQQLLQQQQEALASAQQELQKREADLEDVMNVPAAEGAAAEVYITYRSPTCYLQSSCTSTVHQISGALTASS